MKYPCSICQKQVMKNSIFCDLCKNWVHMKCANVSKKQLENLGLTNDDWYCSKCYKETFPFHGLNDEEYVLYCFNLPETLVNTFSICQNLNNLEKYESLHQMSMFQGRILTLSI